MVTSIAIAVSGGGGTSTTTAIAADGGGVTDGIVTTAGITMSTVGMIAATGTTGAGADLPADRRTGIVRFA